MRNVKLPPLLRVSPGPLPCLRKVVCVLAPGPAGRRSATLAFASAARASRPLAAQATATKRSHYANHGMLGGLSVEVAQQVQASQLVFCFLPHASTGAESQPCMLSLHPPLHCETRRPAAATHGGGLAGSCLTTTEIARTAEA